MDWDLYEGLYKTLFFIVPWVGFYCPLNPWLIFTDSTGNIVSCYWVDNFKPSFTQGKAF